MNEQEITSHTLRIFTTFTATDYLFAHSVALRYLDSSSGYLARMHVLHFLHILT